jgi:ATP-dependent helicase HrpB
VSVLPLLLARLSHAQRSFLARAAPEVVGLPSGRQARVDYESGSEPFVAARLQEFFGAREGPVLAGGRVRLLLHLLAPNHRPVQVTRDLDSFWRGVYPAVRSELRRKYPKHAWPEDPLGRP